MHATMSLSIYLYHNLYQQNMLQTVLAEERAFCEMKVGTPISMHICLCLDAYVTHLFYIHVLALSQLSIPVEF